MKDISQYIKDNSQCNKDDTLHTPAKQADTTANTTAAGTRMHNRSITTLSTYNKGSTSNKENKKVGEIHRI